MARLTRRETILGSAALAAARPALAHRQKRTDTVVEWTGEGFAITHIFHRHDAEVALSRAGYLVRPDIESLKSRALIAIHVEETFEIIGLDLETLGAEAEGNRLYVYQEAKLAERPDSLRLQVNMLRGLFGDHVNAVNIKYDGSVSSLEFSGEDGVKTVELA